MRETERDWREVIGALIAGISHDLNGHVTALRGVAHMARTGPWPDGELLDLFEEQVARLEEAVRLLRAVPLLRDAEPELVPLREVAEGSARLWRRRSGARVARVELEALGSGPVVLVRRRALVAALLLILAEAEDPTDPACAIRLRYGTDEISAWVRIDGRPAGNPPPVMTDIAEYLEVAGGTLDSAEREGRLVFEVRVPLGG